MGVQIKHLFSRRLNSFAMEWTSGLRARRNKGGNYTLCFRHTESDMLVRDTDVKIPSEQLYK